MHKPASVLKNTTYEFLWDFNIQTDHLISARWADLIIINNKKRESQNCVLCCHRVKFKENEKNDNYPDLPCELKKTVEH